MLVIVGEKEVAENKVSVRYEGADKGSMTVEEFIARFNEAAASNSASF